MVEHLRNIAFLLHAQRSSRHRIGGLMFDSILYLKFNSKQSSTQDLAKEILHLFKHLSLEKGFQQQTSLIIMYYITSLANFGNCCSMLVFPFRRRQQRSCALFYNVFLDMIFYPHVLQQLQVLKTIPAPACLVALMIWHSCYHAQTFEV